MESAELYRFPRIREFKNEIFAKPLTKEKFIRLISDAAGDDDNKLHIGIDTVSVRASWPSSG